MCAGELTWGSVEFVAGFGQCIVVVLVLAVAALQAPKQLLGERPVHFKFQAAAFCAPAVYILAVAVLNNDVVFLQPVHRTSIAEILPLAAQSDLCTIQQLLLQFGCELLILQAIEFTGLRRPKAVGEVGGKAVMGV